VRGIPCHWRAVPAWRRLEFGAADFSWAVSKPVRRGIFAFR
jgi:hypothetical protein